MYSAMRVSDQSLAVDRGMALHKLMRLITLASAGHGYLNFMGNEFGHPEWVDFPREGNHWSYHHARRQWRLRDDPGLRYRFLADFDAAMLQLIRENPAIDATAIRILLLHDDDKIIAFERGGLFFFFNFHPNRSLPDYAVETLPGEYTLALDTDASAWGGHARVQPGQHYLTQPEVQDNCLRHMLRLYLPCRSALVLKRQSPE
jgi:1,4-alpha-glucan branching enzyme